MFSRLVSGIRRIFLQRDDDIRNEIKESEERYKRSGKRYLQAHKPDQAVEAFNRELEESPENGSLYRARGLAYYELNDYDRAIDDLEKALRYGVGFGESLAEVYYWRGIAYWHRSMYDLSAEDDIEQAIIDLQRAMELNPEYVEIIKDFQEQLRKR